MYISNFEVMRQGHDGGWRNEIKLPESWKLDRPSKVLDVSVLLILVVLASDMKEEAEKPLTSYSSFFLVPFMDSPALEQSNI